MFRAEKRFFAQPDLDRRGVFDGYTTGNHEFDDKIIEPLLHERPKETAFNDRHSQTEIQADLARVREIQNSSEYTRERGVASVMAEYALIAGLPQREWLGEDVTAWQTSEFDDVCRGVDVVVTITDPNDPEHDIVFGIDITTADQDLVLKRKIMTEAQRLVRGQRTALKYFNGAEKMNRYIIGLSTDQARTIGEAVLSNEETMAVEKDIGFDLADEISYQAYRQIRILLLAHTKYEPERIFKMESPSEMMIFLQKRWREIDGILAARRDGQDVYDAVKENMSVLKYTLGLLAQKDEKNAVKKGAGFDRAPDIVRFLTHYEDDNQLISGARRSSAAA